MSKIIKHPRYWVNVVSHEHVKNGIKAGITQSCHGKSAPLKRMRQGDWIVHYSPKEIFQEKEPCQKFTSIGQVIDEEVYQFDMGGGFIPWRRNIKYLKGKAIPIINLLDKLSFTKEKGKSWGMAFRYGFFEMKKEDFKLIYEGMIGKTFKI
ncbi:MAG: EVE domain-containing protein [Chlamydiae bacterium]|nr:EVE domain-containing protein [Chlamydiota bacterium]